MPFWATFAGYRKWVTPESNELEEFFLLYRGIIQPKESDRDRKTD